jgi:hypothetical protein
MHYTGMAEAADLEKRRAGEFDPTATINSGC